MKTEAQIQKEYQEAMGKADRMKEYGNQYAYLAEKQIQDCMRRLSGQWSGYAANAYQKKMQELEQDMLLTARKLKTIGETLEIEAKRLYEKDLTALKSVAN